MKIKRTENEMFAFPKISTAICFCHLHVGFLYDTSIAVKFGLHVTKIKIIINYDF